jgi:molecular chaperone DnaJ
MDRPEPDLYATLGVDRSASPAQILRAYRRLLRRLHPDTRPVSATTSQSDSDAALRGVLQAYEVLRDPARRAAYDQARREREETRIRPAARSREVLARGTSQRAPEQPPIRVGPVRWHQN